MAEQRHEVEGRERVEDEKRLSAAGNGERSPEREHLGQKLNELRAELDRTRNECDHLLQGDFGDLMGLAEVGVAKAVSEAGHIQRLAVKVRSGKGDPEQIADRLDLRARAIQQAVQAPSITQFRQDQRAQQQHRRQQNKAAAKLHEVYEILDEVERQLATGGSLERVRLRIGRAKEVAVTKSQKRQRLKQRLRDPAEAKPKPMNKNP